MDSRQRSISPASPSHGPNGPAVLSYNCQTKDDMTTILLEKIDTLATFDEKRRVIKNGWILIRDDAIEAIGSAGSEPVPADRRIDLAGQWCCQAWSTPTITCFRACCAMCRLCRMCRSSSGWMYYMC